MSQRSKMWYALVIFALIYMALGLDSTPRVVGAFVVLAM